MFRKQLVGLSLLLSSMIAVASVTTGCSGGGGDDDDSGSAPAAPSALVVSTMGSAVMVEWMDNSSDEDEFMIERKEGTGAFAEVGTEPFDTTSYMDSGVMSGMTYTYRVMAQNEAGMSAASNEASITYP